ncbi:DUF1934 domain-containing protein [Indiicoccus explosivorum]|uniref:DUF1934 domain-containing protein n=1 Tax=Indiicoccus explosivorum TaxID=1917864 RepID=UPI000B436401|nr:DUF1934 domain-containing protein [Indiicoccus explosivorum]
MRTPVKIRLTTTIRQPGEEEETFELHSSGTMTVKNGQRYLQYEERQDELDVRTTVKLGDEEALILRSGGLDMRLPFLLDAEQQGNYTNEQGTFLLTTATHELSVSDTRFFVHYDLSMGASSVGEYKMEIMYTEVTL